jgi:K+-sensing histidine kinase KdpD
LELHAPSLVVRAFGGKCLCDQQVAVIFSHRNKSNGGGGAGLGLAIAYWVAQAHEGRLELQHSGPGGSTFLATLPIPRDQ